MERPFKPTPEPRGDLVPPNRRPPTAIGVATPPPPPRKYRPTDYRGYRRPIESISQGLLGTVCLGAGIALFTTATPWVVCCGVSYSGIQALSLAITDHTPIANLLARVRTLASPPHSGGGRRPETRGAA